MNLGLFKKVFFVKDDVEGVLDSDLDDDDKLICWGGRYSKEFCLVIYVYSFFYLIFVFVSMYFVMFFIGWGNVNMVEKDIIDVGWLFFWVCFSIEMIIVGFYIWFFVVF